MSQIIPSMLHNPAVRVLSTEGARDLRPDVLGPDGIPFVMPAAYYASRTVVERAMLGVNAGLYGLPTLELVDWLHTRIAGRLAIEIGAGSGALASALAIPATDSKMQDDPKIAALYRSMNQPTVPYGPNVERLAAADAVARYKPKVVIACWVTHKYRPIRHAAGGNQFGVNEEAIIARCDEYIFIGNEDVHKDKSIWTLPHEIFYPDWLYSRASNGTRDFIAVWPGSRSLTKA